MAVRLLLFLTALRLFGQTQVDYPSQVQRKLSLDAREYNFSFVNGGLVAGNLSATGVKTVTFTPCPKGVAGSDGNHSLRISGGTGTAETVLITGGTCTSAATSGTIIFTTVNTHTGTWAISSATGGGSEAISIAPSGGAEIVLPAGTTTMYGSLVVVNKHIALRGVSRAATTLSFSTGLTQAAIYYVQGGVPYPFVSQYEISDMTILSASAQPCVRIAGIQEAKRLVHDMYMTGCSIGLKVGDGAVNDSFDHLVINDVTVAGVDADIGAGGGHLLDNITVGTVGQSETPTQFAYGIHAYVPTNVGSAGGITISNSFVSATGTFGPTTGFLFDNQSGVRNSMFVFLQAVVADGTYNTDGIVFRNIINVNAVQSWSVNHAAAPAAAWKIDNSSHILISGSSTGWSAGQGAFAIQNGSDTITISDTEFNGTGPSFSFSGTNSTNLHIGTGNHFFNPSLYDSMSGFVAAINNTFNTVSPLLGLFSVTAINDWVWRNIDAGGANQNKFWRVNQNGGVELLNNAHSATIFALSEVGTGTFQTTNGGNQVNIGLDFANALNLGVAGKTMWALGQSGSKGIFRLSDGSGSGGFDSNGAQIYGTASNGNLSAITFLAGLPGTNQVNIGLDYANSLKNGTAGLTMWALGQSASKGILRLSDGTGAGGWDSNGAQTYITNGLIQSLSATFGSVIGASINAGAGGSLNATTLPGGTGNLFWALGQFGGAGKGYFRVLDGTGAGGWDGAGAQVQAKGVDGSFNAVVAQIGSTTGGNQVNIGLDYANALNNGAAGATMWALAQSGSKGLFRLSDGSGAGGLDGNGAYVYGDGTSLKAKNAVVSTLANFTSATITAPSGATGYTGTITIRNSAGTGTCTQTFSGGFLTSTTC